MLKYWSSLLLVTTLTLLFIYFLPEEYYGVDIHKKWAYLEASLLSIVSGLLHLYNQYFNSEGDAYTRLQSVYIGTFSKFLVAAGVIATYVLTMRDTFTRPTLFLLMAGYLIFLIFITIVSIRQNK